MRLHGFLAFVSSDVAKRAIQAIRQGVKVLSQQPEIGRPAEGMQSEFREWVIEFGQGAYLVLYRYDVASAGSGEVVILAVRHGREGRL